MPKPRLLGGKPLMVGGKVALSDDCCCGGVFPSDCGSIPTLISIGWGGNGDTRDEAIANALEFGFGIGTGLEGTLAYNPTTCVEPNPRYGAFFGHYRWTTASQANPGDDLVIGTRYYILRYDAGDDFTNVGGTNESDVFFVATGTTPTEWVSSNLMKDDGRIIEAGCQLRWRELDLLYTVDVNGCPVLCTDFCSDPDCLIGNTQKSYTWDGTATFSPWFELPTPATANNTKLFGPFCSGTHDAVWAPNIPP